MKIRWVLLAILWVLMSGGPVYGLDPNHPVNNFLRTHFDADSGLPGPVVDKIEQTKDGFLWLVINNTALVRFDGKNFYPFETPRPMTFAVSPDGDLWVGTRDGLVRIPSSDFNQFTLNGLTTYRPGPGKASRILCLRFSKSGVLWVGTAEGLFRYERDQFVVVGPRLSTHRIQEAPDGNLLVINEKGFIEFAGSEVVPHPQLAAQLGVNENQIFDVLKDRQGNTWYCTARGVARETNGRIEKLGAPGPTGHAAFHAYEDAQGAVWIGKDEGLFRATSTGLELVDKDIRVRSIYNDRDGNLWVGTNGDGLHRFKDRAIRMYTTADGLPNNLLMSVIAAQDGSIWTGANCGGISRFDGTQFQTFNEKHGLLNTCVFSIAEDSNRDLWIGTWGGGAFRYHNGTFTQYSKGQGMPDDRVTNIVAARDGSIWFGSPDFGVTRLKNGQFRTFTTADGLSSNVIMGMFEDRAGNIWVGTRQGLGRVTGDRVENVSSLPKGQAIPFGDDRDGGLFINLEVGVDATTRRLYKDRLDPIKGIAAYDLVETEQGELWFGGAVFARMQPGNFVHARPQDEPLDYEMFSPEDGITRSGATGSDRSLALTRDGKLYAATSKGLAVFDLRRLQVTNAKPSIYLTDLTIGRNKQVPGREIVLPPGTNRVEIYFAAVEISSPEKISTQYRLDGVDSEWIDAPPNPVAIYTNIPVGTHTLRIRASNRNGIWDREGVVFSVTQQPYFYQTRWFVAVMVALGILLVFLMYRLRVAQISRMLSARFDERLAERTRVARDLNALNFPNKIANAQ